ncbi:MAG: DNA methyltransferase [Candidatus Kapaibacterium sp.]|nr:MAG: DNA methyltransferase [Candidatus Kapabacteria bacterium]GIV52210.1 MAG: DNA methyltransferase [Candidatus Kapabacteria bacterium]
MTRQRYLQAFHWFGGKGPFVHRIVALMPPHHIYVEPFGGAASVLINKPPSPVEVYNDIDEGLVGFFRVLSDPDLFQQFYRRVAVLPYSRRLYDDARRTWRDEPDPVKRAVLWFIVARQSFSGSFSHSWSFSVAHSSNGMAGSVSGWLSCLSALPEIHARMQRVQIEQLDWRDIIDAYDTSDTLFYCDPPYPHSTRSEVRYAHELTDDDHRELIDRLVRIQGMALLSSYPNEIYAVLRDHGWQCIEWQTACYALARTRATGVRGDGAALRRAPRTEVLWISPRAQERQEQRTLPLE